MKRFSELSIEQLTQIVNSSKKLREELDEYIQECELHWLEAKIRCVKSSLSNWSVGFYNDNFLNVRNYKEFVDGVETSVESFGGSEKLEKKLRQVKKLRGTNLFEHTAEQLKNLWFEEEIQSFCDYVEDASAELYGGQVGERCKNYIGEFFDGYDDYLYDEDSRCYYIPQQLEAA